MKSLKCIFAFALLLFLLVHCRIEVSAMNTRFSTKSLPEQEKSVFLDNIDLSLTKEQPKNIAIACFDVNENGLYAIGQKSGDYKSVCIYSPDGHYQYGYNFNCSGSFGIEWDDDIINIYFARSDIIIAIDQEGEVVDVAKVENTTANNTYINHFIYSTKRTLGDTTYVLRNNMGIFNFFASSYSQLIATNTTGNTIMLYDVNSTQFAKILITFVTVCIFILVAVLVIIRQFVKTRSGLLYHVIEW